MRRRSNKISIYIPEEAERLVDEAQKLLGQESLSSTVIEALRRAAEMERARREGFSEIEISVGPEGEQRTRRFIGRFLAEGVHSTGVRRYEYAVYQGLRGRIVVVVRSTAERSDEYGRTAMGVYEDVAAMIAAARHGTISVIPNEEDVPVPQTLLDAVEAAAGREPGEWVEV